MIYLNCAATSKDRPPCVAEAVLFAMEHFGSGSRGYGEGEMDQARCVMNARMRLARLLNAPDPERVVFCANVTEALNLAVWGVVRPGDHVVATAWDHNSVLRPLYRLQEQGVIELDLVPADEKGRLDYDALASLLRPGQTRLVALSHASNLTGNVADVARVSALAHEAGALVLLDAAQSAGALPVDMQGLGVDLLAFTGHKALLGPTGTGGLAVGADVEVEPVLTGGTGVRSYEKGQPAAYPERLEAGTLNGHGIAGLSAGVQWLLDQGVDQVHAHDLALVRRFVEGVRQVPGAVVYGDLPDDLTLLDGVAWDHAPVVSVNLEGWASSELADALAEDYGIAVRAGAHCAPRMHEALGTRETGAVRFSFGPFTSEDDVDAALGALRELAAEEEA